MSWAKHAIAILQEGKETTVKPRGNSMLPLIKSGQKVVVEPVQTENIEVDDIVLVKVKGRVYLHLIKAIDKNRFQIGNNKGYINGWVGPNAIYGRAVNV